VRAALSLLLLAFLAAAPAAARADEPLRLRIGWVVVPGHLFPVLFQKKALLRHYGQSYTVEPVHFQGSAPQVTALAAGELDIANLAYSTFALAIQNAHMDDVRVIADSVLDGRPGYFTSPFVVRGDSGITKIEDLKGKVVATNAIGGALYMGMRLMLLEHGLQEKRDYQVIETQFPNMIPMLLGGKADLVSLEQVGSHQAPEGAKFHTLFTLRDAMGETQTTLLAARAAFIAAHRAALVDFFEDLRRSQAWMVDPAHRAEALKILAAFTKRPAADFAGWVFTKPGDDYRDPDLRPNLDALQHNIDAQRRLGFLTMAIDVKKFADLSLITDAAARPR
jgi:sulfonate transport system substrate-binding protein